jgi:hypothetical protein
LGERRGDDSRRAVGVAASSSPFPLLAMRKRRIEVERQRRVERVVAVVLPVTLVSIFLLSRKAND